MTIRPTSRTPLPSRFAAPFLLVIAASACAACGKLDASIAQEAQSSIGQCTRDQTKLHGPPIDCVTDLECPCGSFCQETSHTCAFQCNIPPGGASESCPTDSQCDDRGRCVGPGVPTPAPAGILNADPQAVTTVAGGAAQTFKATLRVADDTADTRATTVRVLGRDGAEVSCDATNFGSECALTGWTFSVALDSASFIGAKSVWVRTPTGTPEAKGNVLLHVDATGADFVVPAGSRPPTVDGLYVGTARSTAYPDGLPVTVSIRGEMGYMRDPNRIFLADGIMLFEFRTASRPCNAPGFPGCTSRFSMKWLRGASGTALTAALVPQTSTVNADGTVEIPFKISVAFGQNSGLTGETAWTTRLTRVSDPEPECQTSADCAAGQACSSEYPYYFVTVPFEFCVPADFLDTVSPFEDERSAQWWNALSSTIGSTDPGSAFGASTGGDLLETLMCTTDATAAGAGRLGLTQVHQGNSPSFSGDLACVGGDGLENHSPGAVGLTTYRDRHGTSESDLLLNLCLDDLARPATPGFASNFDVSVGECVNLGRLLPALRLFATGELSNAPQPSLDIRSRGLFLRLVQQWTLLHGFLASTGLAARELDDAVGTSVDEAKGKLLGLLDTLDAGWSALLDKRVVMRVVSASNPWFVNRSDVYVATSPPDYRTFKLPTVYWPFDPSAHRFDMMRNAELVPASSIIAGHPHPTFCDMDSSAHASFMQWFNCPGYRSTIPAERGNLWPILGNVSTIDYLLDSAALTVLVNIAPATESMIWIDDHNAHFKLPVAPPYLGGTLVMTPTFALGDTTTDRTHRILVASHPYIENGQTHREEVIVNFFAPENPDWLQPGLLQASQNFEWDQAPARGMSLAVVRDPHAMTYTFYVWDVAVGPNREFQPGLQVFTRSYQHPVEGRLISPDRVLVGAAGPADLLPGDLGWQGTIFPDIEKSYFGAIDDVAVYRRPISQREFVDFATKRGSPNWVENERFASSPPIADLTQEIDQPFSAQLLEAQAAHLDVVVRLLDHMRYQAQAACENDAASSARAEVDAIAARAARTLRQSHVMEAMTLFDDSDRTNKARDLLRAKRARVIRSLKPLTSCTNPYGMSADEVPLYHGDPPPGASASDAFFAASDHMLSLAQDRVTEAAGLLSGVRHDWDLARQSQIQQLQTDTTRDIRVGELNQQYGDGLIRLCGIGDQTPEQVLASVRAGQLSVENCYVKPTSTCLAQHSAGNIADLDQSCYRGIIGANLMEVRAAYRAQQAAYQAWSEAKANAEAEQRLCVLQEMDAHGCSALDRHALSGVVCPANFKGTEDLVHNFNVYVSQMQAQQQKYQFILGGLVGVLTKAFISGDFGGPINTWLKTWDLQIDGSKRALEEVLTKRANEAAIRQCWDKADQFARAIASQEQTSLSAMAKYGAAAVTLENSLAQARETVLEAPVVLDREINRPSIPIAFNYWLPESIDLYRTAMERARRYTYLALRATEYDMQERYTGSIATTGPSRAAVLSAWRPSDLQEQLHRLHERTDTRTTRSGRPSPGHMAFDIGTQFFGLGNGDLNVGTELASRVRPVFSTTGTYLGEGLRFTLLPRLTDDAPVLRCAERIMRVNFGSSAFPSPKTADHHVKLLKANQFASRLCDQPGFQVATHRDEVNLLTDDGEELGSLPPTTQATADLSVVSFDVAGNLDAFQENDAFTTGSSVELVLQGLYGDYVLLFPKKALDSGVVLTSLHDVWLRFDFVSVDNTPPTEPFIVAPEGDSQESVIIVADDDSQPSSN